MPVWYQAAAVGALVLGIALLVWAVLGDRARGRRRCPRCWYDMAATPTLTCPECGKTTRSETAMFRSRRRWWWAMLALVLLAASAGAVPGWRLATKGWAAVPGPVLILAAPWASLDPLPGNGFPESFSKAVQLPLPAWQQRLLVRRLATCMKDPDPKQRALAAAYVGHSFTFGGNELVAGAIPDLVRLVDDPDPDAAYLAANSLAALERGNPRRLEFWERLLRTSPHENVRSAAAVSLAQHAKPGDRRLLLDLSCALIDPSDQVVSQAVYGLGFMRDTEALPALMLAAASRRPGVDGAACHGLELLGPRAAPAIPVLLGIVRETGNPSAGWAVKALGRIGPAAGDAIPDLVAKVRAAAAGQRSNGESAIALGRIGDPRPDVMEALIAGLGGTASLQKGCVEALYRLGWKPQGQDRARIEGMTQSNNGAMRVWARMLLARADGALEPEIDRLIPLLNGREWWVSEAAILALESLGPQAGRALPALEALRPPQTRKPLDADTQLKWQAAEPAIRVISGDR